MKTPFPLRFAFVENEPLQLSDRLRLARCSPLLVAGDRRWSSGRSCAAAARDRVEAALRRRAVRGARAQRRRLRARDAGGPASVHGRAGDRPRPARDPATTTSPDAGVGVARGRRRRSLAWSFGVGSVAHASNDDFDALLRAARPGRRARELLVRAQHTHPTDYFYAWPTRSWSRWRRRPGGRLPALHALNRALRLCPSCEQVHVEVARNLWHVGQARPGAARVAHGGRPAADAASPRRWASCSRAGAKPEELAAIAASDPGADGRGRGVSRQQSGASPTRSRSSIRPTRWARPRPRACSCAPGSSCRASQIDAARATLAAARRPAPTIPGSLLEAQLLLDDQGRGGRGRGARHPRRRGDALPARCRGSSGCA